MNWSEPWATVHQGPKWIVDWNGLWTGVAGSSTGVVHERSGVDRIGLWTVVDHRLEWNIDRSRLGCIVD